MRLEPSSTLHQPNHSNWVEALFDKMLLSYRKKFTDQWGGTDPDKLFNYWANELSSFTELEIVRGIKALDSRDWPPSLPEFKKMCRPPVDSTVAYYEALNGLQAREAGEIGEWSHPGIFWAAIKIGAFDFKNQSFSTLKARWEKALEDEMSKGEWAAIPVPMVVLPAPGKSETAKEEAAKMIKQMDAEGMLKNAAAADHRAWIRKVLERRQNNDQTLPLISVTFAKEAVKVKAA